MHRRSLFVRFAATSLWMSRPFAAVAQSGSGRLHRVAVVKQGAEGLRPSFREAMQELGYVEGRNLLIETRGTKGDNQQFPSLIAELIATKPDVIVAETTVGALAAKRATSTIPIVMLNVSDPVGSGLVASLGHPGGNVTGATDHGLALADKSVDLVRAIAPSSVRLGVLMSDIPVQPSQFERIRAAADRISLSALSFRVASLEDLDRAFAAMVAQKIDAFIPLGGAPLTSTWQQVDALIAMAAKARLPAVYGFSDAVIRGGLMSYATSLNARWKLAATYVDRIFKGARPADLPVRQPMTFELFINRKTAASLGLTIPPALLLQADRIIS
jgi:putative ABC transport system substrate-binding protein